MEIKVEIKNLARVKATLAKYPLTMAKHLQKAITEAGYAVYFGATKIVPVKTGYLRMSHGFAPTIRPLRAEIQAKAPYAIYVHEGTRKMKSRPWLLNAISGNKKFIEQQFEKAVEKTLEEVARGA